jgi:peptidoglycan hydrolase CwlO-like protein
LNDSIDDVQKESKKAQKKLKEFDSKQALNKWDDLNDNLDDAQREAKKA